MQSVEFLVAEDGAEKRGWAAFRAVRLVFTSVRFSDLRLCLRMVPVIPEFRKRFGDPQMLSNLERAAQRCEAWSERRSPGSIAAMQQLMQQQERTKTATAAKA
jgi:hypothetical protein